MERQYLVTERAHFMCPNMHFGIQFKVRKPYNHQQAIDSLDRMAEAHPFLKSLIAYEEGTNRLYYHVTERSQIQVIIRQDENTLWEDYQAVSKQDWNVMQEGLLKVLLYPDSEEMTVLFIINHLLADGRGALELAQEFANDYAGNRKPVYVEERLIQNIDDLPEKSALSGISKWMINQANKQWKKENHILSYEEYLDFVRNLNKNKQVKHKLYELQSTEVSNILRLCHENDITVNDYLMACMFRDTKAKSIIIASDIRNKIKEYHAGACGNYATAMGIEYNGKSSDIIAIAKKVHKRVKYHMSNNKALMLVLACYFEMNPTLLDASATSALGGFQSKAAGFAGRVMFHMNQPKAYSITNLGSIKNEYMRSVVFIPPASLATKLTLGVVTLNGEMKVCSSVNFHMREQ